MENKKEYHPPKFKKYGSVGELTEATSPTALVADATGGGIYGVVS